MLKQILVPIALFASCFGAFYVYMTARHRERIALIERGMHPQDLLKEGARGNILKWSLLLIGVSLGVIVGEAVSQYTGLQINDGPPLAFCSSVFFGGIALLVYYIWLGKK